MTEGEHSQGCVFILYSIDSKLDLGNTISERDLNEMADLKLCSPKNDIYSRFGFSLTTSTNDEENFEIYIGAPTLGMDNLTYQGIIYYYESYLNENGKATFSVLSFLYSLIYVYIFRKVLIRSIIEKTAFRTNLAINLVVLILINLEQTVLDGLSENWIAILVISLIQENNHMKRFLRPADMKQQTGR